MIAGRDGAGAVIGVAARSGPRAGLRAGVRGGVCARLRGSLARLAMVAGLVVAGARPARAQTGYTRFDVTAVGDTTFTFLSGGARWVSPGQRGIAVDPAHNDELIAKFRVLRVRGGMATALITGQTGRLTTAHVALLRQPQPPFYLRPWFWLGALGGGVIGYVIHH